MRRLGGSRNSSTSGGAPLRSVVKPVGRTMNAKRTTLLNLRLLAVFAAVGSGLGLHKSAAWVVRHDTVNFWLRDNGFRFVSNRAEEVFSLGPVVSAIGGLLLGIAVWVGLGFIYSEQNDSPA